MLARAGFRSVRGLRARLEPFEIDPRQFALLNQIALREGVTQQAIADAVWIPKSRMVPLVDDLERRGLVERRAVDRRSYALHLTAAGHDLLRRTRRAAQEHDAELTEPLGPEEREQLLALLTKLAERPD
jgi:DNA-binding MarR family transcriptional regulator